MEAGSLAPTAKNLQPQKIYVVSSKEGLENDLRLYFTRHDECIVEVSNTFEDKYTEDGVIDILADVFEHRIDNWEPFRLKVLKIVPTTDTIFKPFDDSDYDD